MTHETATVDRLASPPPPAVVIDVGAPVVAADRGVEDRSAWRVWFVMIAVVAVLYALLWNPYWVPGGDSELYIAAARSLAKGEGFKFNGQFISISPPGWPLLLAGAMKLSPTFGFLKILTILCMIGAMGLWYWVLLRLTRSPRVSAVLVLATAMIQHVYSLSFWMHSDALFCLTATGAMLLACQINERRRGMPWRLAGLLTLCFVMTFVRWAGVLQWLVIAGLLVSGLSLWPRAVLHGWRDPRWLAVLLSLAVTFATFFVVRDVLYLSPEEAAAAKEAGATLDEQQTLAEARTVELLNNKPVGRISLAHEYWRRFVHSGKWFAWLLWPEMRFLGSANLKGGLAMRLVSSLDTVMGWVVIALLLVTLVHAIRRREWLWVALAVYCGGLCLNWPNPNARYLVPVAPLVVWGVIRGVRWLALPEILDLHVRLRGLARTAVVSFLASILICSGVLYATDLSVAHSRDFYAAYEGRQYQGLIAAAHYLNQSGLNNRELGVGERYINLGRARASKSGLRVAVMLTDRVVQNVPMNKSDEPILQKVISYNRRQHIRWYLYQQPISPWRVWHFRVPAWVQEKMTHEPVGEESGGWVLYHVVDGRWVGVDLPEVHNWPTRIPGM